LKLIPQQLVQTFETPTRVGTLLEIWFVLTRLWMDSAIQNLEAHFFESDLRQREQWCVLVTPFCVISVFMQRIVSLPSPTFFDTTVGGKALGRIIES
jgi:hypothetical protein